ncbi:MAG: urea carboxylase, partial [Akkermansiaceae bacterium]|nr:urea carboxylase [Akkermansiaceae bacterium]
PLDARITPQGASMEVRLYAEDPLRDFQPSPGVLTEVTFPEDARVDTWISTGTEVSPYYDPMIAKNIVHGEDRADALAKLRSVLSRTYVAGISTNLDYLRQIAGSALFAKAEVYTGALAMFEYHAPVIEVIKPGTYTTIQDYPGRIGYWDIGVPPSGPMDDYAFRLANRIVGNDVSAAALECTLIGPKLRFHVDTVIALTGAISQAKLDGEVIPFWTPVAVKAGQVLDVGKAEKGCRSYLAVRHGFDVPLYLGSRSTFALGQFGGHGGRTLRGSDMLAVNQPGIPACTTPAPVYEPAPAPVELIPDYPSEWEIGVLYGPHGAPDFFTEEAIDMLFASPWEVHYNSNRLGIRLNGPKPTWARTDGGEAGLHPSNIHDTEYAIGAINFTGDMPVILTKDGPSLGGFVCPLTIAAAELWKVGQVKPGDTIRFRRIAFDTALTLEKAIDEAIETLTPLPFLEPAPITRPPGTLSECIIAHLPARGSHPEVAYRQAGDKYILLEYGPVVLDLRFRFRVHALMEELKAHPVNGILELSPGVRSLQVHYDSRTIPQAGLIAALLAAEEKLPAVDTMKIPTRVVHLPMAYEDSATLDAVARYRQSVRDTAPWLPSNSEFIRRINGLESIEEVKEIIFKTRYLVLGLGDVYLGAPCAVPVDPRHRLLTSKYNPARTYTAEGTVGIGGVYMCIYGMDSPGGYQLVGRTVPIWNKFLKNPGFEAGKPWLLRFFDQVCYYPVSEEELNEFRDAFREGRATVKVEEEDFELAAYERFLIDHAESIESFQAKQKIAFEQEVALWKTDDAAGQPEAGAVDTGGPAAEVDGHAVHAEISGNIWKLLVEPGQMVNEDDPLLIVEAMKMEFHVYAGISSKVSAIHCQPGKQVKAGDLLVVLEHP